MSAIFQEIQRRALQYSTRREFLRDSGVGLGATWLATQGTRAFGATTENISHDPTAPLSPVNPQLTPKVKRVIFLHMVGAPSQLELFDYKPDLQEFDGKDCPSEYLEGQRFAFIQGVPQMLGPVYKFDQHGESGTWMSDRLPNLAKISDDLTFIKTMTTDQFNHGPAQLMVQSGHQNLGYPSIGAWTTYGLGSENQNLPGFIVLLSGGIPRVGKSLWTSGFLPSVYQGVQCRSSGDPVLNIKNPRGVNSSIRRSALDSLNQLNQQTYNEVGDPETVTRMAQYEMAFRMQMEAPEVMNINDETATTLDAYGAEPGKESFANNCLLARRLCEAGVRFIQLYDMGWDSHGAAKAEALNGGFVRKCERMDKPVAALITDLKQRGLLDETLVVWGAEFGRTPMQENRGGQKMAMLGRDHNPNAFTYFMAGAGVKKGMTYGETDRFGYHVEKNGVHISDFHATLLELLGYDHKSLTVPFQGLNQRLTGVKEANVVRDILS